MKSLFYFALIFSLFLIPFKSHGQDVDDRYKVVIEESYFTVAHENKEEFIKIYKEKIFPFWREMKKMGLIEDDIKMYAQRIHPFKPQWTYKTVVRFTNYQSIDKWLEKRDKVKHKLFPQEGGYKKMRAKISAITVAPWDDLERDLTLE